MNKKWSLYLGKIFGIQLYIHWTFWILIGWIFLMHYQVGHNGKDGLMGVFFILSLFLCVVLHEFGHALTARRYNIVTRDITLYPIGGVASLESMPEKPTQELWVALAGPFVNVIIAALLYFYLSFTGTMPDAEQLKTIQQTGLMGGEHFLFNLFAVNVMLVLFNLIPAFPMDGGRVLRALLAFRYGRAKATSVAAGIGQFLAIIFVFFGFFNNFWLVFIGLFIYLGAGGEAAYEATKSALANLKIKDVMMKKFTTLNPDDPLSKVIQILLDGQEKEFIVMEADKPIGFLTLKEIVGSLSKRGDNEPIASCMNTDFVVVTPALDLQVFYTKYLVKGQQLGLVIEDGVLKGIVDRENIEEKLLILKAMG